MFEYQPQQMAECATRLRTVQLHAAGIMELAADANPDWYIWGALGQTMAPFYWQQAEGIYEDLKLMGESLRDRVETLEECESNYRAAEEQITQALGRLKSQLDG